MSPRAAGATQHELSRIGLLATLSGETLAKLAQSMTREEVPAGTTVVSEGEEGDRGVPAREAVAHDARADDGGEEEGGPDGLSGDAPSERNGLRHGGGPFWGRWRPMV